MALGEIAFVGSWLLIIAVLVLDLAGIPHRGAGFRLQGAGLLVMNTAQVVSMPAHLHSRGIFPVLLAGFALLAGGLVVSASKRQTVER